MKVRASITLSEELLRAIDKRIRQRKEAHSAFIEAALRAFITRPTGDAQSAWDLEIINRNADFLNQEALDMLEYSLP